MRLTTGVPALLGAGSQFGGADATRRRSEGMARYLRRKVKPSLIEDRN